MQKDEDMWTFLSINIKYVKMAFRLEKKVIDNNTD